MLLRFLARRPWLIALFVYLCATPLYTRHAIDFPRIANALQAQDSLLSATIMRHAAHSLLAGGTDFFDLGIFHPFPDTLFLTEPMLLGAVAFLPLWPTDLWPLAYNLFVLASFLAGAIAGWALARALGASMLPALWCGFYATFSADRLFHVAGHAHLLFHAGFALLPLAFLQMVRHPNQRRWAFLAAAALIAQSLGGFYITAIASFWWLFLVPACVLLAWTEARPALAPLLRRQVPVLAVALILLAAGLGPVLARYSAFGRDFPQNSLETVNVHSATIGGYLLPSTQGDDCAIAAAHLARPFLGERIHQRVENDQFIGVAGVLALLLFTAAALRALSLRPRPLLTPRRVLAAAIVTAGALAFVLSLGPFPGRDDAAGTRLPFAYLYAWVEPLRFMRGPARFAFSVQWAIALLGSLAITSLDVGPASRARSALVRTGAALLVVISAAEYFPLGRQFRIDTTRDDFAAHAAATGFREPIAEIPVGSNQAMIRKAWTGLALANGYSGYAPASRYQELEFLGRRFPDPASLQLLSDWGVRHVLVAAHAPPGQSAAAAASPHLNLQWNGQAGRLYELTTTAPLASEPPQPAPAFIFFTDRPGEDTTRTLLHARILPSGMDPVAPAHFRTLTPHSTLTLRFAPGQLRPADYTTLSLTLDVDNWYALNDQGAIYWSTPQHPDYSEAYSIPFTIPARHRPARIDIPLAASIPWRTSAPVSTLRINLTRRTHVNLTVYRLALEPAVPVRPSP